MLDTSTWYDSAWNKHVYAVPRIKRDSNWNLMTSDDEEWKKVRDSRENNPEIMEIRLKYIEKEWQEYREYAWLSKRFFDKTFSNFELLTETHKKVVKFLEDYCIAYEEWKTDKWLYICWWVGVGKTHLVAWLINALCCKRVRCIYKSVPNLLNEIKDTFDTWRESQKKIIDRCSRVELLVLDDIWTEKPTDWVAEVLYTIINNRYENMKTTVFTSNLKVPELWDRIWPRISDRIYDMCQILDLSRITKSYRWRW